MSAMKRHYEHVCNRAWIIYRSLGVKSARGYLEKQGLSTKDVRALFLGFAERI